MPEASIILAERVRSALRITVDDMAEAIGTSKMSYHRWLQDAPIRESNRLRVRTVTRILAHALRDGAWDAALMATATKEARRARLAEIIKAAQDSLA